MTTHYAKHAVGDTFAAIALPGNMDPEGAWDPLKPRLRDCELPGLEKARLMLKFAVHDKLVPCLSRGADAAAELDAVVKSFQELTVLADAEASALDATVMGAIDQLKEFVQFGSVLLGREAPTLAVLDKVMNAREGAAALVKQTIRQCAHWRSKESSMRKHIVVSETVLPHVWKCITEIEDKKVSWEQLPKQYVSWIDTLPSDMTQNLVAAVVGHLTAAVQEEIEKPEVTEQLRTWMDVLRRFLDSMPPGMQSRDDMDGLLKKSEDFVAEMEEAERHAEAKAVLAAIGEDPGRARQTMLRFVLFALVLSCFRQTPPAVPLLITHLVLCR